ncbi:MAG: class I SAM-dependent methyltransferase [Deltaproteobacteria bacterium]|nr:class I SAM-dependent methyltransferase [Deltaproteobacteria bacterium]
MSAGPTLNLNSFNHDMHYSDGESEQRLLAHFKEAKNPEDILSLLTDKPDWPTLYHLSPERENLLSWFDFNSDCELLEIGAGCGALTGLFCRRARKVTAVELTRLRAEIILQRCKHYSNLEIIVGDFNQIEFERPFDYVTCIGVLEYAGRYGRSARPYDHLLARTRSLLKPGGCLILAIENKFGLKYWSGCREDHTGRMFESIEGYPGRDGVQTFDRGELERMLNTAGYSNLQFYYPLPDYKLPVEIFSDAYLPSPRHSVRPGLLPTPDPSGERAELFDEALVMDSIIGAGQFSFFANSFLVFAKAVP